MERELQVGDVVVATGCTCGCRDEDEALTFGVVCAPADAERVSVRVVTDEGRPLGPAEQRVADGVHVGELKVIPVDELLAARLAVRERLRLEALEAVFGPGRS